MPSATLSYSHPNIRSSSALDGGQDAIDAEIVHFREEIAKLRKEQDRLISGLLSSTEVQQYLISQKLPSQSHASTSGQEVPQHSNPLYHSRVDDSNTQTDIWAQIQARHTKSNVYRLAFGVTTFPFSDPSPENRDQPLLIGVRIEIPSRTGRFDKQPYYIFLKRFTASSSSSTSSSTTQRVRPARRKSDDTRLKIHHHTIPAHVPLHEYERLFLPLGKAESNDDKEEEEEEEAETEAEAEVDDGDGDVNMDLQPDGIDERGNRNENTNRDQGVGPNQDLHGFVNHVRRSLLSWNLRTEAISFLIDSLDLMSTSNKGDSPAKNESGRNDKLRESRGGKYSVTSLSAPETDARHIRIVWADGSLGRLKISEEGEVEKAVVYGETGRFYKAERALSQKDNGDKVRVEELVERLQNCHEQQCWK